MKKILFSTMLICAFTIVKAQVCGSGPIKHYSGKAPLAIDGDPTDWFTEIVGPFAYSNVAKGGFEGTPHTTPVAAANVQLDGLRDSLKTDSDYDMDRPGQPHRDLRYFAFTYDDYNVYFYFRRPKNNTAQVTLYYFVDINVDGYMQTGEPVIQVTFNNSGSDIKMGLYTAVNSNGTIPGSYVAGKGNRMTAPSSRPGDFASDGVTPSGNSAGSTQWVEGAADGWNMPGSFTPLKNGVNLPLTVGDEFFGASTITDTHTDGTEPGYAVEFAVPWKYLGIYTANGGLQSGTALPAGGVFTWHVSLQGGNSGVDVSDDNAGGCCQGLAVSGAPIVSKIAEWKTLNDGDPFNYRLSITFTNGRPLNTKVTIASIKVINPRDANGAPLPQEVISNWTATGYRTNSCNGNDAQIDATAFTYISRTIAFNSQTGKDDTTFLFSSSDLLKSYTIISGSVGATACYFVNVYAFGWPPLASATVSYQYETAFDIQSVVCGDLENGSAEGSLGVLPVKFTSFNAARSGSNVNLTWQTSTEAKSKGFEVQRFIGTAGGWETIGFVATQAPGGNSNSALNYAFTDLNNTVKGISQYRLKQVDIDNRSSYSIIRSVRGQGQSGLTIVYPNPSSDGKVNIVFQDASGVRDISVNDMSGRVVKQMKGVTNNNIVVDNLVAGMYTVRIVNNETGEQEVQKFVVNKR